MALLDGFLAAYQKSLSEDASIPRSRYARFDRLIAQIVAEYIKSAYPKLAILELRHTSPSNGTDNVVGGHLDY